MLIEVVSRRVLRNRVVLPSQFTFSVQPFPVIAGSRLGTLLLPICFALRHLARLKPLQPPTPLSLDVRARCNFVICANCEVRRGDLGMSGNHYIFHLPDDSQAQSKGAVLDWIRRNKGWVRDIERSASTDSAMALVVNAMSWLCLLQHNAMQFTHSMMVSSGVLQALAFCC